MNMEDTLFRLLSTICEGIAVADQPLDDLGDGATAGSFAE